ncbi:MAG: hypothetical protein HKN87_12080 [Saprospiraceae bacterium]|nr:hypothetical protein [Saprospiraceae bacterium]
MTIWHIITSTLIISLAVFLNSCTKEESDLTSEDEELAEPVSDSEEKICTELYYRATDRAFGSKQAFWNKKVLKVRFLGGGAYVQSKIKEYANEWSQHANINFQFVTREPSDIRISFDRNSGSWSYVGQSNRFIGTSRATMNFGWFTDRTSDTEFRRTTLHEFGHAIGLSHEHQHPEASIQWNREAVYSYYQRTQDWSRRDVDANIFQRYNASSSNFSAYDPSSIMHYYIPRSLVLGPWSAPWNSALSTIDKQFIASIYPKSGDEPPSEELSCACTASITGIACDNFEDLTSATFPQTDDWKPWSTNGNMGELQTYSWGKVLKIQHQDINNPDVVYAPATLNDGTYELSWDQYIGPNSSAYFNIQKGVEIGQEFGAQFYFDTESSGQVKINQQVIDFNYTQNQWLKMALILDFENNQVNFSIEDRLVGSFPNRWSAQSSDGTNQFTMLNFYAIDADTRFWLDNFCLSRSASEASIAQSKLRSDGFGTFRN